MGWLTYTKVGLAVATLLALGACRQGTTGVQLPLDDNAPVTTDRTSYPAEHVSGHSEYVRYSINVSYTNTTSASVYLVPCSNVPPPPDYQLEHYDTATWAFNYSPVCRTGPGNLPATEIEPGEAFSSGLVFDAYISRTPENYGYPLIGTEVELGITRVVLELAATVDDQGVATGELLPLAQRISNAFMLETP